MHAASLAISAATCADGSVMQGRHVLKKILKGYNVVANRQKWFSLNNKMPIETTAWVGFMLCKILDYCSENAPALSGGLPSTQHLNGLHMNILQHLQTRGYDVTHNGHAECLAHLNLCFSSSCHWIWNVLKGPADTIGLMTIRSTLCQGG